MKTATHYRDLLDRETAHLSASEKVILHRCKVEAKRSATALRDPACRPFPELSAALALWLLTKVEAAPLWLRIMVAKAALEDAQDEKAAPVAA